MLRPMPKDPFVRTLAAAADQSIVACGAQQTVIAGYHWFSDWDENARRRAARRRRSGRAADLDGRQSRRSGGPAVVR